MLDRLRLQQSFNYFSFFVEAKRRNGSKITNELEMERTKEKTNGGKGGRERERQRQK